MLHVLTGFKRKYIPEIFSGVIEIYENKNLST